MKKIALYIIGLLIIGISVMPLVVKKQVASVIDNEKNTLQESGVELSITKEEGYISSHREFELKITNGKKFRDFIFNRFAQNNPNYKGLTEILQKQSETDIRPALDGTLFKGNIKNSNLLLSPPMIELSLSKLSDEIMSSFNDSDEAAKLVHSVLDEKLFTFFITLDSNQKVSQIIMQDIDKDINESGKTINVKLKNHKLDVDVKESLKGTYTLGKQSIKADDFYIEMEGISYSFDYLTQFENSGNFSIDSFKLKENNDLIKIGKIKLSNSVETNNKGELGGKLSYEINDFYLKDKESVELDNLVFNFSILGLNKDEVLTANNYYSKLAFNQTNISNADVKALTESVQKILNRGFKSDAKISLNGLNIENMSFKNLDLTMNAELEKNDSTLDNFEIINSFLASGIITVNKEDINNLLKINMQLGKFTKLGKEEGDNLRYDYEFKQGKLYLNGTEIK